LSVDQDQLLVGASRKKKARRRSRGPYRKAHTPKAVKSR